MIYNFNLREGSLEALLDTGHSIVFVAGNMKTNFYPAPATSRYLPRHASNTNYTQNTTASKQKLSYLLDCEIFVMKIYILKKYFRVSVEETSPPDPPGAGGRRVGGVQGASSQCGRRCVVLSVS